MSFFFVLFLFLCVCSLACLNVAFSVVVTTFYFILFFILFYFFLVASICWKSFFFVCVPRGTLFFLLVALGKKRL